MIEDLPYKDFKNRIVFYSIIYSVVVLIIIFFILTIFLKYINMLNVCKGFIAGSIVSIINFKLIAKKIEYLAYINTEENINVSSGYLMKNFFIRYLLMGLFLAAAAYNKTTINLAASIIGMFSVQITIYIMFIFKSLKRGT